MAQDRMHPRSELIERFVALHGNALMRVARSHAGNAADADDAYQRTLEVMLTKAPETDDHDRLMAWASTVARNEALMQHRRRKKLSTDPFDEIAKGWVDVSGAPDEQLVDSERLGQGREVLQRLSPDQTRLLLLRADGHGCREISELTGFSRAKVSRLLCEGRKAFRQRIERLDSGAECRRLEGVLSMMADGEVRTEARHDAELHLAGCLVCQATLREFSSAPSRAAELLPLGAFAGGGSAVAETVRRAIDSLQQFFVSTQERALGRFAGASQGSEVLLAKKAVTIAALSASIVAGGVAVDFAVEGNGQPKSDPAEAPVDTQQAPAVQVEPSGVVGTRSTSERKRTRDPEEAEVAKVKQSPPAGAQPQSPNGDSADDPARFDAPEVVVEQTEVAPETALDPPVESVPGE